MYSTVLHSWHLLPRLLRGKHQLFFCNPSLEKSWHLLACMWVWLGCPWLIGVDIRWLREELAPFKDPSYVHGCGLVSPWLMGVWWVDIRWLQLENSLHLYQRRSFWWGRWGHQIILPMSPRMRFNQISKMFALRLPRCIALPYQPCFACHASVYKGPSYVRGGLVGPRQMGVWQIDLRWLHS